MGKIIAQIAGRIFTLLGYDGTDFRNVLVDEAGHVQVDALSSGLPTGAATEATLATMATEVKLELCRLLLVSIDGVDFATGANIGTILTELQLKADLTETQPVSAATLPLPTGAATEATLATMATEVKLELCRLLLVSIDGVNFATGTDIGTILTELQLKADLTETQPVSAASLPLPTGAATQTTLAAILTELAQKLESNDLLIDAQGRLVTVPQSFDGIDYQEFLVDSSGHLQIDVLTAPLPTGAATQTTLAAILTELAQKLESNDLLIDAQGRLVTVPQSFDGSNYQEFLVDSDGHLQIDVLTSPAAGGGPNDTWGYYDRWAEALTDAASGAGDAEAVTTAVPANYVYVLQGADASHNATADKELRIIVDTGTIEVVLAFERSIAGSREMCWSGEVVLKVGDTVKGTALAPGDGKSVWLNVWGYKMQIPV